MVTEIKADEALLWLRSYHAETLKIAREGMAAWRDLNQCIVDAIQFYGSLKDAPQTMQDAHARHARVIERCRTQLEERSDAIE